METRKPLDPPAIGLMVLCCLIWGFQQISLKASAHEISPIFQLGLRSGMGAVLVALLMFFRKDRMSLTDGTWKPGLLSGLLFAAEFVCLGEALRFTTAAHSVVMLYTAPIFAALGLHWKLASERLARLQWLGIALAFGGIIVTFLGRDQGGLTEDLPRMLLGDLLALLGGALWGATTIVVRTTRLSNLPATHTTMYQLVTAGVVLVIVANLIGQTTFEPTWVGWSSLAYQTVVVSFFSLLAWFWLLRRYLASSMGVFSFLAPLFGVLFGAWLLDEAIEPNFVAGACMVLAGIVLVSGHGWLQQVLAARRGGAA